MTTCAIVPDAVAEASILSSASPNLSSAASSLAGEEEPTDQTKLHAPLVTKPQDPGADEDADDAPTTGVNGQNITSAFGHIKNRAATASKTLGPQFLNMKDKTSKKFQPSLVRAKSSATAAASKVKVGSTQSWSIIKTTLAAAGPAAGRIHSFGLNAMTDIYLRDTSVEMLQTVEDSKKASCAFLLKYKVISRPKHPPTRGMGLLRITRSMRQMDVPAAEDEPKGPADQCFATPYILGTILVFCGEVPALTRMACVNKVCRDFIASERKLVKFCVRYGHLSPRIRFAYWEKVANVAKIRDASELDYDTYLQMALSKGDATESIMTDVRRTYGRVAPHKRATDYEDQDATEDLTTQLSEILHALAGRFPTVGYCQGMDYIAAHLLNQVMNGKTTPATKAEAESTFWLLVTLFENYGLQNMFAPGLQPLHEHCFQTQRLLALTEPALAEHFVSEKVPVEMFAVGWFQTLYLYLNVLPQDTLNRIWDIFLYEKNWKMMLRVALALLQLSEKYVMGKPIDEIMHFFNTFADSANVVLAEASLIESALRLKVTKTVLAKLQKQYYKHKRVTLKV
ncbi:hypothetical protein CCR75_001266 [Bremia lactucae]|uniref:Rab-GAP TBC domain-containing protein n=1 Tax=Bremia lactucae TaxID=4779 RepID=A0A976IIK6_BRELC|nr:hypothetical protein CCR75_001266 [Bremia lactucae]